MNKRYNLVDSDSWQSFFSLVLFCGIALILSIPSARQVRFFDRIWIFSGIPVYFYTYILFMGIIGLNLGAISARRGERGWMLLLLFGERLLLAQFLTLPYLLFERAAYPGKEGAFVLIFLYTYIVSFLCALTSRLIEEPTRRISAHGFLLKYSLFIVYYLAPLSILPPLSPLGAVASLLSGEQASLLLLAYATPVLLALAILLLINRQLRRDHSV